MTTLNKLFPNHLKKLLLQVSFTNYTLMAIGILNSIIMIRLMGPTYFGKYQYCLAITEFPAVFYSGFDRIINRFITLVPKERHHSLVYSSFFIHIVSTILFLIIICLCFYIRPLENLLFSSISNTDGKKILIFSLLITFLSGVFSTMTTYMSGIRMIKTSQMIIMSSHIFGLLLFIILFFNRSRVTDIITQALGIKIIGLIMPISFVIFKFKIFFYKVFGLFLRPISSFENFKYTVKNYFNHYAFHFQITDIFGHFKDRIGILILGHLGSFSGAAYYEIIKNIIALPRKYFSQMFNLFIPKIIHSYTADEVKFAQRFKYFCYVQTIFSIIFALVILLSTSLIIKVYSFENLKDYYFLTYLECLTLILTAWANNNYFSLEIGTKSRDIMQAGLGRGLIIGILSPYLILKHGAIGSSFALLLSTIFLVLFLSIKNKRDSLWAIKDNLNILKLFLISTAVLYFTIAPSFTFYKYIKF